jgi:hypothetical protein
MKKLAVIGDSFMSAYVNHPTWPNIAGTHFSEILCEKYGIDLIMLARGGSTTRVIRSQVQYAIDHVKPDYVLFGTTYPARIELPINNTFYNFEYGLLNFNYDRTSTANDLSFHQLKHAAILKQNTPSMTFDSINSIIGYDGLQKVQDYITDEQRLALEKHFVYNYSRDWSLQVDTWLILSGCYALKDAGIKFSLLLQDPIKNISYLNNMFEPFRNEIAPHSFNPWDYTLEPPPYHIGESDQVKLADLWAKRLMLC